MSRLERFSTAMRPAWHSSPAITATRMVNRPYKGIVICDAGHKSVSADAGVATCVVVGHPELMPLKPSEEHLPLGWGRR